MNTKTPLKKVISLALVGCALSFFTYFLGAPFWRVLRREIHGAIYYTLFLLVTVGFWVSGKPQIAALLGSMMLAVGVQLDFEKKTKSPFYSGFLALLISGVYLGGLYHLWTLQSPQNQIKTLLAEAFKGIPQMQQLVHMDVMIHQLPSVVAVVIIFTLAIASILEKKVNAWFGLYPQYTYQGSLLGFNVPEYLVWVAMFSFLASFVKAANPQVQIIGANILNVMYALYFLQGIAVMEVFFRVFRAGSFVRAIAYFAVLTQAFVLASLVGFADYWINFRSRLAKIKAAKV